MAEYYVVLGDVVHSREIEDREAFQDRLAETCARFTAKEREDVYGDFTILKGIDEFGGVLQSLANLYEVVTTFQDALRPHGVRIVVASGSIDVGLTTFDVEKMDGEAFHRASERLEEIEDDPLSFDLLIDDAVGRAIADEINLLLRRREEWTDRQREVIEVRRKVDTQAAAAERLDVTQQAVSNVLSGADWPLVETVEGRLRETLREYAASQRRTDDDGANLPNESRETELNDEYVNRELAKILAERDEVTEALTEYMRVLDQRPTDTEAYFEYAEMAIKENRHPEALGRLFELLNESIPAGYSGELVQSIQRRLHDVIEPVLANATYPERVKAVLDLLIRLAERTTGAASEDVRLWSIIGFARWLNEPNVLPSSTAGPETRATEDYGTGLGFLLSEESETAVKFFKDSWEQRDELTGRDRGFALAAGAGLLGCAELLGPSILDDSDAVRQELAAADEALRKPARHFLAYLDGEASADGVAEAVHDDLEQFSRLEAEAFAAFASQLERRDK